MIEAISFISSSLNPRVVTAGVPRRIPEVTNSLLYQMELCFCLLSYPLHPMQLLHTFPVIPSERRSISTRWLSVPPDTISMPSALSASASATAFFFTCWAYALNSGFALLQMQLLLQQSRA